MIQVIAGAIAVITLSTNIDMPVFAKTSSSVLPSAGLAYALDECMTKDSFQIANANIMETELTAENEQEEAIVTANGRKIYYSELVVARVTNYVNVRDAHDEVEGKIVGKLYNNSIGTLIKEEDGWYQITSGNCTGWVKGEYCVKGEEAVALVPEISKTYATVTTTTLKLRSEAGTDATVLGMIPFDDDFIVLEDLGDWVKISTEFGDGYVSKEFVSLNVEFVYAESKIEEEIRKAKEEATRKAALEAARKEEAAKKKKESTSNSAPAKQNYSVGGSGYGTDVANYALQFVGNPYRYGGSSLTNGTDCSGFVMSVYANFGVSLPHSSKADRSQGYEVEGGLANAQPGDLVCYSGHVALYIGDGKIVHASTEKTGIIVSNANYKTPITVRRIF